MANMKNKYVIQITKLKQHRVCNLFFESGDSALENDKLHGHFTHETFLLTAPFGGYIFLLLTPVLSTCLIECESSRQCGQQ